MLMGLWEAHGFSRWEVHSETIELHSPDEVESETVWKQCEQLLADRNGVSEYDVETPW